MKAALAQRVAEQDRLIDLARRHVDHLARLIEIQRAAVVGSVARGDFNVWSDVDVIIVAEGLPERILDRLELLMDDRPPRVEVLGFTPAELEEARRRNNPIVRELDSVGIPLR